LGLNLVKSLSASAAQRIESARQHRMFSSTQDLATRAHLNRHEMDALATANALYAISGHRRQARWQAARLPLQGLLRDAPIQETTQPVLPSPSKGQNITADYHSTGLTLGRHPVA